MLRNLLANLSFAELLQIVTAIFVRLHRRGLLDGPEIILKENGAKSRRDQAA